MNDQVNNDPQSTVQKLKLLVNNAGAPQMVKDSLIQEIEQKGATPEVMDRIIQAFETEKDILVLTINSVTNLKQQIDGAVAPMTTQSVTPPPVATPQPPPTTTQQPQSPPPQTDNKSNDIDNKQKELEKLLAELKELQAESPTDKKTDTTTAA